jgi:shikimate kinase
MAKIVLVGYMAVGKSTVGKILAEKLKIAFVDLDENIEREENLTISEIFAKQGEIYFRKKEHLELKKCLENPNSLVIATGGGTPCYANNHLLLNGNGITSFYLKASISLLYDRLLSESNKRPLISGKSEEELKEFIAKHLFDRSYFYHQATHHVSVDGKTSLAVAEEILQLLD